MVSKLVDAEMIVTKIDAVIAVIAIDLKFLAW
jgi:hypothetical protein